VRGGANMANQTSAASNIGKFVEKMEGETKVLRAKEWIRVFRTKSPGYQDFSTRAITPESVASIAINIFYIVLHEIEERYKTEEKRGEIDHQPEAADCKVFLQELFHAASQIFVAVDPGVVDLLLKQL